MIAEDRTLDQARTKAVHEAQVLIARQAPVAGDLRIIVTTLRTAEKIERMGDLAHHIAVAVRRRHPHPVVPDLLHPRFDQMGTLAARMATTAGQVLRDGDHAPAGDLVPAEDEMDDLHRTLFTVIHSHRWPHGVLTAIDAALLSRYYERFADHAVSITRRAMASARQSPGRPGRPAADATR